MPPRKKDLGQLTPTSFRDYVRFNSVETVLMHFRTLDSDGSGEMTVKEFRDGVHKLGFEATKQEAAAVFKWLDNDGSGVVVFRELDKKLRENPVDMNDLLLPPSESAPAAVEALPVPAAEPPPEETPAEAESVSAAPAATQQAVVAMQPRLCTCAPLEGRICTVAPSPLFLRLRSSLDSERVGNLPLGAKVFVLAEERAPGLIRARVASASDTSTPLGWVTSCREGSTFLKLVSASKACGGFFTSGQLGSGGFAVTYSMAHEQERYSSVAAAISMLQQGAQELQIREERLRLTGTDLSLDRDPMAVWSFQSGGLGGHA